MRSEANRRIHLTRWAVTALAEKHRRQDHRLGLPGPRRPQLAGDANVRCLGCSMGVAPGFMAACLLTTLLYGEAVLLTLTPSSLAECQCLIHWPISDHLVIWLVLRSRSRRLNRARDEHRPVVAGLNARCYSHS